MAQLSITNVKLLPKKERRLLRGHRWVYKSDTAELLSLEDGAIIDIYSSTNRFIGRAFYQKQGNILGRIISYHQEEINEKFFKKLLNNAIGLRIRLFPESNVYRWVHAEVDGLPGAIIDRYDKLVVAESNLEFYRKEREFFLKAIRSFKGVDNILTKFSSQILTDTVPEIVKVKLNGLDFLVPIKNSQKTGLFLDQRMNYIYSQKYMPGAKVLDCFSYIGVWSCHAISAGAKSVVLVESSENAIEVTKENLKLNGFDSKSTVIKGDVTEILEQDEKYDVIILDPPAYIKKKEDFQKGFNKYVSLNSSAIRCLNDGGFLITCSCSHFVSQLDFREIVKRAIRKEGRRAKLLEFHGASPDHPEHFIMPELSYLKCAIVQVL
ncbi:MAG: class I SAM-dependent rRNA methyltransferase [Candidatus Hydrogenedentes bacterium]|nr:class I SAM-dependent rRNA methyltransferase [Candidatus Hydrogenedentota bacterium]